MGDIGWNALLDPTAQPIAASAASFIVNAVMSQPDQVTLAPIGPLTNIALALRLEPRIAAKTNLVMMGGSVIHPGNVSPLAEANIWNDPHAARIVFDAEWPIVMAGLDVTERARLSDDDFAALRASGDPLGVFVADIARFYQAFCAMRHDYPNGEVDMHDPTVFMHMIAPELFKVAHYSIGVEVDGLASGATIADRRGRFFHSPKVTCLMDVDAPAYRRIFRERLTRGATRP